MSGGDGADTLTGAAGADSITGGGGADTIVGGTGNDTVSGGDDEAADVIFLSDSGGTDTINVFMGGGQD